MEAIELGETSIRVGRDFVDGYLPVRNDRSKVAILTQAAVGSGPYELASRLRGDGLIAEVFELPDREDAKTLQVVDSIYERLATMGLGRFDTIVGYGGGSVTDVSGFVAGTWLRGVEAVQVPTTLLGSVDAAIGGKTGVNFGGKNLVGVFWPASRVIVDLDTLDRLPRSLKLEGMAEILKAGYIGDPGLIEILGKHRLQAPLDILVPAAIRVKVGFVEKDPREDSIRAMLNFGHTIGHAVEFSSSMSHGESVAVGMVAAAAISTALLGFGDEDGLVRLVGELDLPTEAGNLDRDRVLELIGRDKKRDFSGLRMVLLQAPGEPLLHHVDAEAVDIGLAAIGL